MSNILNNDPKAVRHLVDKIKDVYKYDPEAAHGIEDDALWAFVRLVAGGQTDHGRLMEVAWELLKLDNFDRTRWCA